jgi:uncharacterized protein YaaN involved in tellurite resistance
LSDLNPASAAVAVVDPAALPAADLATARQYAAAISADDSQSVIQYGISAQKSISGFADTMLSQVRSKDAKGVGESLTNLLMSIKDANVGSLSSDRKGLLSNLFNSVERFFAKYEKIGGQIDRIVNQLSDSKQTLMRDISMLDLLYKQNIEYLHNLDLFIAGGKIRLEELKSAMVPKLEAQAKGSGDPMDAQKLNDFKQFLDRLEKKIYDLQLSRMIAIQTSPQVRLIQNNDSALVEKIQSSIMTTIPLWKSQIVIAISLIRQQKALKVQKAVTDETNELLMKNSEMLKDGSIGVAKEMERGIVEIETLKKTNDDLIATIEETLRIQEDGRAKRAAAEQDLAKLESDLKAKLIGARG